MMGELRQFLRYLQSEKGYSQALSKYTNLI